MVRHDWGWFPFGGELEQVVQAGMSGWDGTSGIGTPTTHPGSYIVVLLVAILRLLFGTVNGFHIAIFAICVLTGLAADTLARALRGDLSARFFAVAFSVFNPWFYNKLVAGHTFMLLAYSATLWIGAILALDNVRNRGLVTWVALTLQQIQFFAVTFILVAWLAIRHRQWTLLLTTFVIGLPIAIGVLANWSDLAQTPLTLSWERDQSISPGNAIILLGYFPHYASAFEGPVRFALILIAAVAAIGALTIWVQPQPHLRWLPIISTILVLFVSGTRGPAPPVFQWAILHIPALGLFRELYDLLGYLAIAYIVFAVIATRTYRGLSISICVAALSLPVVWILFPPKSLWVSSTRIPVISVTQEPNTRFALLPAFQPVRYDGVGSGMDPDAFPRHHNITPINEYLAVYPVNKALATYAKTGNTSLLAGLGVAKIYARPWLQSDWWSLQQQTPVAVEHLSPRVTQRVIPVRDRVAELSLLEDIRVGTLVNRPGSGAIFYGDLYGHDSVARRLRLRVSRPVAVVPPNNSLSAAEAWVDARIATWAQPETGQPFGGALTTNPDAVLPISGGDSVLAWVQGTLRSADGTTIYRASASKGYSWVQLPPWVSGLRCLGECIVALQGSPPPHLPLNPPPLRSTALSLHQYLPWLMQARIPHTAAPLLRLNVAFNRHWVALLDWHLLEHVRIDGAVNGWILPPIHRSKFLVLVETTAGLQYVTELLALGWLLVHFVAGRLRSSSRASRSVA